MGRACSSKRKSRKGSTCRERPIDPQLLETEMLRREEEDIQDQIEAEQAHIDAHQARLETFQIRLEDIQARLAPDVWGNVTSDEDILRMSEHLRADIECTGIYIRMDLIQEDGFEIAKASCTAVRVTYNDNRAPDGKLVTKPEYLAPSDPLPVLFSFADANPG
ncbi:hypothetical protein HG530_005754 [Fusarium avenaceum]|nr:hypothetical protein HG530_005754 [Fusarium avenaceum]